MARKRRLLGLGVGCVAAAFLLLWAATRKPTAQSGPSMPPNQSATSPTTEPEKHTTEPVQSPALEIRFTFDGSGAEDGTPAQWSPTVSAGKLQAKVVTPEETDTDHGSALWMRSEQASFLLTHRREFDVTTYPILRWSWQATVLPTDGDVRKNALLFGENRNDQAIQLLVVFEGQKVLSFVWDSTAPVDTEVDEPSPLAAIKTRVVDSGSEHLGEWRSHEVDLQQEYRRRFGQAPGKAVGVIVQSNSNHTRSIGEGLIREITVSAD